MVGWITPYPYKHISRRNSCRLFPNIQITVPQAAAMIRSPPGLVVPLLTLAAVKRKNFYCIICTEKSFSARYVKFQGVAFNGSQYDIQEFLVCQTVDKTALNDLLARQRRS